MRVFKSLFLTQVSPSNLLANAAFFIEIGCTSKMLEMFKNDRIIVKTGLACCPKPDPIVQLL